MLNKPYYISLCLLLVFSCDTGNSSNETAPEVNITSVAEDEPIEKKPIDLISADSTYQIKFFKTATKLNNGTYPFAADTLQYSVVELTRIDSNYILELEQYKTRSPSAPEYWLTISVEDNSRIARSNWHLCEATGKSYKFYFAYDAFNEFDDSLRIWWATRVGTSIMSFL